MLTAQRPVRPGLSRLRVIGAWLLPGLLLALLGCGGGESTLPQYFNPPDGPQEPCDEFSQIAVFDDSDVLDDQFDVFVDGQFAFRTPVGDGAANDTCLAGFGSGPHTLRIELVQDIDDPDGSNPDEWGTYGVLLGNGVTFVAGPGTTSATTATGDLFPPGASDTYEILVP